MHSGCSRDCRQNLSGQGQAVHSLKCNHRCHRHHHHHVQCSLPNQNTDESPCQGQISKKWNWKESLRRDFRWAQKLALNVSVSLASLGVFGICLPRDSYFEFGSLGTHWPPGLPHRHLPPPSIRLNSRTVSGWYFLLFHCCFKCLSDCQSMYIFPKRIFVTNSKFLD